MFQDKTEDNRSAVGEYEKTMARKKINACKPMKNWFSIRSLKRAGWDECLEARAVKCSVLRESVKPGCRRSKKALCMEFTRKKKCYGGRNAEFMVILLEAQQRDQYGGERT